ncbi:MAG TPA: nucleoside-diphosphate kinase [Terriglobales bacterium]|nr:nucleoside-diphosphate kinase [Terriglobales bacterium]
MEQTLLIIKPDAVNRDLIGEILKRAEKDGFRIEGLKMIKVSPEEGGSFYQVHKGKPFYQELVDYISSGKVVVVHLKREKAVEKLRELIGATDPKKAQKGTIRSDFGLDICHNSVHASDSNENAKIEIDFFFGKKS